MSLLKQMNKPGKWVLFAIVFGVALRIGFFFVDQNIWRDEANLLLAIQQTSLQDLGLEMPYGQRCAVGPSLFWKFTMITKGWMWVRFPSLVFGIASIFLFRRFLSKFIEKDSPVGVTGLWLFAVSPQLILYSNQVKTYGMDVFFLLLMFLQIMELTDKKCKFSVWKNFRFLVSSLFVVCCSLVSPFILGTCFVYAVVKLLPTRRALLAWLGVVSVVSAVLYWSLYLSQQSDYDYLQLCWTDLGKFAHFELMWWVEAGFITFFIPFWYLSFLKLFMPMGLLWAGFCFAGIVSSVSGKTRSKLIFLLLPTFAALLASMMKFYPYAGRLIVFMIPGIIVLGCLGIQQLNRCRILAKFSNWHLFIPLAMTCFSGVEFLRPQSGFWQDRSIVEKHWKEGDGIVLELFSAQIWNYYRTSGLWDRGSFFPEWVNELEQSGKPPLNEWIRTLPKDKRLWVVASSVHYHRTHTQELRYEAEEIINQLKEDREVLFKKRRPRSTLLLFSESSTAAEH